MDTFLESPGIEKSGIEKTKPKETKCTHCALPVPAGLIEPDRPVQFCCSGCSGAYELIHSSGLDSFYRMADQRAQGSQPVIESRTGFQEFDEAVFQEKYARQVSDEESTIELAVDGIHCGACVWLIEKLPTIQTGVVSATANWTKRTVTIRWRVHEVALSQIAQKLNRIGYRPIPVQQSQNETRWKHENRQHLARIGAAAACAGNNMIISAALYFGMFSHMTSGMSNLLRAASCAVGLVALVWPGRVFLKSALSAIRTQTPHMDLPIALGLSVGTLAGLFNVLRGAGEIYFDSLSVLIFLLLIGRWIQFRQQAKAANAVEMLYRLTPQMARKIVDGQVVETLVDLIEVGDSMQVLPGDLFPVDGEIVEGSSRVDESILTGESETLPKSCGDSVAAGTRNESSMVVVRAMSIGQEMRISRIVELVEKASNDKPEVVQWANQVGGYFVSTVLVLALFTFGYWWAVDFEIAIDRTIALLIVACPCALALATPLAIAVALGKAAKQGIMVKGGDVLQSLQKPGMIWLDKTGTITVGQLRVDRWQGDTDWIGAVAALEQVFIHPVANAFVRYAEFKGEIVPDSEVVESESFEGKGIRGLVGGNDLIVGKRDLITRYNIRIPRSFDEAAAEAVASGLSPCWVAVDEEVVAVVSIGDSIRQDSMDSIEHLKRQGWEVGILSGDHQQVVDRVAERLGVGPENARGGVEPEQKLAVVKQASERGTVIMVGDGVNDSAALAAATVGIAVKGGAEASLAAAPVYLADSGLQPILGLLSLSDSTAKTMRFNLGVSLAYNIAFAGLAFVGMINPLVAAVLMPISSLTVVALSVNSGGSVGRSIKKPHRRIEES